MSRPFKKAIAVRAVAIIVYAHARYINGQLPCFSQSSTNHQKLIIKLLKYSVYSNIHAYLDIIGNLICICCYYCFV